jgi:hypothetical protein
MTLYQILFWFACVPAMIIFLILMLDVCHKIWKDL